MPYRIGSFNVKNLSYGNKDRDLDGIAKLIKKFDIVALQEVLSEGKILYGSDMKSVVGQAKAYERSLMRRLGSGWEAAWCAPISRANDSPFLGEDTRGEGYVFLWRTDKFMLPKDKDGKEIKPSIFKAYNLVEEGMVRLIREPAYGRFVVKGTQGAIGRPVEIRLITTHIIFGKPKINNLNVEIEHGSIVMRKNEFKILAGQIYNRINENQRDIHCKAIYTLLLGDYNLNLPTSSVGNALISDVTCFDKFGRSIPLKMKEATDRVVYTVQDKLTTVKFEQAGYANNYDHFTFDDSGNDKMRKEVVKGVNRMDAVNLLYKSEKDEDEKFKRYRSEISDHVPVMILLDC